jgi:hypothetical protein
VSEEEFSATCTEVVDEGTGDVCGKDTIAKNRCPTHYQAYRRRQQKIAAGLITEDSEDRRRIYGGKQITTRVSLEDYDLMVEMAAEREEESKRKFTIYELSREWLMDRAAQEREKRARAAEKSSTKKKKAAGH